MRIRRAFILFTVLSLLLTMLVGFTGSASAGPPTTTCKEGDDYIDADGVFWTCKCVTDPFDLIELCIWITYNDIYKRQAGTYKWYRNDATGSVSLTNSAAKATSGGAGNRAEGSIQTWWTDGKALSRPLAVRVIVKRLSGSTWQVCHDTDWQTSSTSVSRFWKSQPMDCGPGYYRTKSAGEYYSYSLARWLGGSWVETGSVCAPAAYTCGGTVPTGPTPADPLGAPATPAF
jgi:hypothetical protein